MRRKSFKALSLALTAVMILSSVNPAAVAVAAPVEEAAVVQQADTEEVTTEETSEEVTEADVTEEVTEVATTEAATEVATEVATTEAATEVATTEETTEKLEATPGEVEGAEKIDPNNVSSTALLSTVITNTTLLSMVVSIYNTNMSASLTNATITVGDLQNYNKELVFNPTTAQINAVTNVNGLGVAVNATSIDISKFTKVTSIADAEFQSCNFTTFKMPTTITSIGDKAFYECVKMSSIYTGSTANTLPSGLTSLGQQSFYRCNSLTTITIPTLSDEGAVGAFQACENLVNVTLGNNVTKVPVAMFHSTGLGSTGMTVTFGSGLDKILGEAFRNANFAEECTIDLSKCTSMTGIDASAFRDSQNLTKVILPSSLTQLEIGAYAFAKTDLSTMVKSGTTYAGVYLPSYVTSVGDGAFYGCEAIQKVTLSPNLPAICDYTFDGCTSLETVEMQSGTVKTTWIGDCAFRQTAISDTLFLTKMTQLTQIGRQLHDTIDNGVGASEINSIPLGGVNTDSKKVFNVEDPNNKTYDKKPVGSEVFTDCPYLESITIPSSVRVIAHRAFYSNETEAISQVATFTWSNVSSPVSGIQRKIYAEAFVGNYYLETVILPENNGESLVIGPAAFRDNASLTSVGPASSTNNTLPKTLSNLGAIAFFGCESLPEIHIQAYNNDVPVLGNQTFEGCYSLAKATLPSQTTVIPYHFFAGCPLDSFNFSDMVNLVQIEELVFLGHQFKTVDLSASTKLQEIGSGSLAYLDAVKKDYMDGTYNRTVGATNYTVWPSGDALPLLTTVILPETVSNGLYIDTGLFYAQSQFTTLYKKNSAVSGKVVIPSYVLPDNGGAEGIFACSGVSQVIWAADTDSAAVSNRWTNVGPYMFLGCENIVDAKDVLPKYVVNIHNSVFAQSYIKSADLSQFTNLEVVGYGSASTTGVSKGVFATCPALTVVKFPATTTATKGISLMVETFKESTVLSTVDLGAVTSLGTDCFTSCTGLETIDLKNVKTVGQKAFLSCTSLATVDFGVVETIGTSAFQKCSALQLTNTPLPDTLKTIDTSAFYEATSLGKVTFGSGLEKIAGSAFGKSGATTVDFTRATSLSTIEASAFAASSLKEFNISNTKVSVINSKTLYDCHSLTKATFGEEIAYISKDAIAGCPKLQSFEFYTTTTVDEGVFHSKGTGTGSVITGQDNGSSTDTNVTIAVTAHTPEEVIIPMDRTLDFPYYVNLEGTSNIHYLTILDENAPTDMTVEEHLFVSAKTNNGYYKVKNSNQTGYKVSDEYYESLSAAPTTVTDNKKTVDVIQVTGLKESGSRDLRFKIYADIQFTCADTSVSIKSAPFEAEYKIKIQDPQTTGVLYSDSKLTDMIPVTSNIQVTSTNMSVRYYYDLVDKIVTGAEQTNYNVVVKSSNPDVLAVGATATASAASGTCTTAATSTTGVTTDSKKSIYLFPKALGTATITIYPTLYDEAEREKHKTTYTFTVTSNIKSLVLEVPSEYRNKLNPGSAFSVFKEYTNYFDQKCSQDNMSDFTKFTNSKIEFVSSDPDYVSVDQRGNVKILKADAAAKTVSITATYPTARGTANKTLRLSVKYPDVEAKEEITDNLTGSKVIVTKPSKTDLQGEVTYEAPVNKKNKTVVIPDTVTIYGIKYKVTAIKDKAFKNNKTIKTVKIGKYVKTIGKEAFSGCTALTKVTIGNAVEIIDTKAFYNCKKLKTVTISASKSNLKKIETSAFHNCKKLTKITLPKMFTSLGSKAFYNCKKLKTITVKSSSLTSVGADALKGIHKKAVIKVPKKKLTAYKTLFKGKGQKSSVKIKKG